MRLISRAVFREILASALLGSVLFTFVLFLQRAGQLFEILVRNTAPPSTVAYLFGLIFPQVFPFTLPLGVLVGVLIALGRMSSDGEITALRAAGVPGRVVMRPILLFAALVMAGTAACSLWLTPWSMRERFRVINHLIAAQLTAEIQPRVFAEQFPNRMLYVGDVIPGPDASVTRWRQIFMADLTPPEEQPAGTERGEGPRVTLATDALAVPDVVRNRLQLTLMNGSTHEVARDVTQYSISAFPRGDQVLDAQRRGEIKASRESIEMDTRPLYLLAYRTPGVEKAKLLEARIELHQRFALPLACVLLALVGIPLGVSSRKGGRSTAIVVTVALAFLYYMGMISLINLARQGTLRVDIAVWTPNAVFALMGLALMIGLESSRERDVVGAVASWFRYTVSRFRGKRGAFDLSPRWRIPLLPGVVDTYVLSSFLFYFGVLLVSFVLMTHVFTFFELLSDMVKNKIPLATMGNYLFFLTPKLIYDFTPFSVLVGVLICFGILSKHNEITALKACGVSLYRLAIPILVSSLFLSGGLFAFDHYVVPEANRRQDALRAEIKGRPVQTFQRPERRWIFGRGPRIFYIKYYDQSEMAGVHVYEIDMKTFSLKRHIVAEKARWEPSLKTWVFQNGWAREMSGIRELAFHNFNGGAMTFREITEAPDYFVKEVKQSKQMNFQELDAYIRELQQGGFDTVSLQVQYYKKFSVPAFALIMALVSIPFAFLAGNRGAMTGVGLSFAITIAYWSVSQLFEQVGNVNQLPAALAAWAPAGVFALAGTYFMSRLRT